MVRVWLDPVVTFSRKPVSPYQERSSPTMALNPYDDPGTTGELVTGSVQAICTLQCAIPFWSESELPWHEATGLGDVVERRETDADVGDVLRNSGLIRADVIDDAIREDVAFANRDRLTDWRDEHDSGAPGPIRIHIEYRLNEIDRTHGCARGHCRGIEVECHAQRQTWGE